MSSLNLASNLHTFEALVSAYSDSHRHYHTTSHIESCLQHLDEVWSLANQPDEISLALWFHDAVYRPYSSDNELKSANWAKEFLIENSVPVDRIDRIRNLIMATLHDAPTRTKDESLMVDIDLAILGSSACDYKEFENAIREEYRRIPDFLFWRRRKQILSKFLAKDRIYQNRYLYDTLETQAKENLSSVLASGQSGI